MSALRQIGLFGLAASFGAVVHLACAGGATSLGNAATILRAETITPNEDLSVCRAGYAHKNACCAPGDAGCREYDMSPFAPCLGDGSNADLLYADPRSPCCRLDDPTSCDGGTSPEAGSCFYDCAPTEVGSCGALAPAICNTCEVTDGIDAGCVPSTCGAPSTCTCPSGTWPATSQGAPSDGGATVCCQSEPNDAAVVCFSIAVGPLPEGSGSGTSMLVEAGVVPPPTPPATDGGTLTSADSSIGMPDGIVVGPVQDAGVLDAGAFD